MKRLKWIICWLLAISLTTGGLIVFGHLSGKAPETASAGQLTEDMIKICMMINTPIGTNYVEYMGFLNCCLLIRQD